MADRGVVVDLDMIAEDDARGDMGSTEDDAPHPDRGFGSDDRSWMNQRLRREPFHRQQSDKAPPRRGIGDPDDEARSAGRLVWSYDWEVADHVAGEGVVEEASNGNPVGERAVERLPAEPARAGDVQGHAWQPDARRPAWSTRGLVADAVGVALLFTAAVWVKLAGLSVGDPAPVATLLLAMAGVYVAARVLTLWGDAVVPLAGACAGVVAFVVVPVEVIDRVGGPLGYANATAAFFALAAASSLLFGLRARSSDRQLVGILGAVGFALVPLLNGSNAGSVSVLLLPFGLLGLVDRRWTRVVIVVVALGWASVVAVTVGLAGTDIPRDSTTQRAVDASLTSRRTTLWNDALTMMATDPWNGVGPRRFARESPTAIQDEDARWAHHEYLQLGAETGVAGLVLALALPLWAFTRLWIAGRPDAAVAAVGLAGVAMHAAIDYVMHFWPVALLAAALVAAGAGGSRPALSRR